MVMEDAHAKLDWYERLGFEKQAMHGLQIS
jgi:hypothetical protein